ncbi:MAG: FecR domain-containing protein [Candidatus Omnitrophota bacterium]
MIKKYFFGAWILAFCMMLGATGTLHGAPAESTQAGVAAAVKGDVQATTPPSKTSHMLKSGDKVFMGDKVETGADGQLQILLLDQTVFTLGPLSAITVDEFVYDPSNDEGKVKASMVKGIFRVVSGKVAHKKSENMSVDLPAGSIGFRGTNVAGIIDGQKTTVVLLGPVGVGRIYVTNVVNGEVVGVDIDQAGNATIVDGPNVAPVAVFQVSEADLNRIASALGQKVNGPGTAGPGTDATTSSLPKGQVDTQSLVDLLNNVDDLNQTSTLGAQDAAQESAQNASKDHSSESSSSGDTGGKYTITSGR